MLMKASDSVMSNPVINRTPKQCGKGCGNVTLRHPKSVMIRNPTLSATPLFYAPAIFPKHACYIANKPSTVAP